MHCIWNIINTMYMNKQWWKPNSHSPCAMILFRQLPVLESLSTLSLFDAAQMHFCIWELRELRFICVHFKTGGS